MNFIMEEELVNRIRKLENELKSTKYLVIFLILMFIILAFQYITVQQKNQLTVNLVRTRGLILQDEKGRDRILMGNPLPYSELRKRTDKRAGLLMMDEMGNDRLFIGKQGALQVKGKLYNRIDQGWGFLVNDQHGNERGGLGMLDSLNSMVLGLNYPGREGIMIVAEPDHAFMAIHSDSEDHPSERMVFSCKRNAIEKTEIKISDQEGDDRIILQTASEDEPHLVYRKKNGLIKDLFQ
jgi:hypothetical protein